METDEKQPGKNAAALSGGHLCHVCGYQYPNPHPSAKLRRSHRKHCGKAAPAPETATAVVEEEESLVSPRAGDREECNAGDGRPLGNNGGKVEEKTVANGASAALLGSASEAAESVEGKAAAEHASSDGTRVHHIADKISENGQLHCISTENASPDDKVVSSELSKNGLVDCTRFSELVNEDNGAQLPIDCKNGRQNEVPKHCSELGPATVSNPAEREDSFDDFQDASPFLHQSDLEDGAIPSSEFPADINNLNTVFSGSSVAANEIFLGINELHNDKVPGRLNLDGLSASSKAENGLSNGTLSLVRPGVNPNLEVPYESYVNVGNDNNHTDMIVNEPDKRFYHGELIGDRDPSSLQACSVVLNGDSESKCPRMMQRVMENTRHAFHNNMYEASPTPEAAEVSNAQLEILTGSDANTMPKGNELTVVHSETNPTDSSTELSTQNQPLKDTSVVQLHVENSTAGFENNLPPTSYVDVDDTVNSITKDSCNDMDFTFEETTQQDIVEHVNATEENPCVRKSSGFTEDEICNKEVDPEVPTEDQFSRSQKHAMLQTVQTSCAKSPFDLDDDRNDDLFELPTDNCYLEVPSAVSRQQVDSASLMLDQPSRQDVDSASLKLDQPTVSNQTWMPEVQHNHNSSSASSSNENGHPIGPKDMQYSSSGETVMNDCLTDAPLDHCLQKDETHTNDISFVSYQVAPMESCTIYTQDTSALDPGAEGNTQTEDAAAKEMIVACTPDIEMKRADNTTAKDTYAINGEATVTEDTAAKMNEVLHCNIEEKHIDSKQEVSVLQSMSNLEENKMTEDPNTKEMNAHVSADDHGGKWQDDDTSSGNTNVVICTNNFEEMFAQDTRAKELTALQHTEKVDENKQTRVIVGQEGDNKKEEVAVTSGLFNSGSQEGGKEEIAVTGGRLNSGRIRVPLKVLLAEASAENKVNKPSAKERVLSFGRRVSKNDNSSAKAASPKSGPEYHRWDSPAKLPRKDTDKSSKGRKQSWMPFICCHSVR